MLHPLKFIIYTGELKNENKEKDTNGCIRNADNTGFQKTNGYVEFIWIG